MQTSQTFGALVLCGLAGACGFDTGGVASGSASVGLDSGVGGDDTTAGTGSASASASTSASTSGSASGSASASAEDSGTDPDATDAGATDPTSASDPGSTSDPGTSNATASDAGSTGEPMTYDLMPTDQSACDQPLWCHQTGNVWTEVGEPTYGQQCFTSPASPPFELLSVHYVVADVAPELSAFVLEVYSHDAGGPNEVIWFAPMTVEDATVGSHEYVFEPPVQIVDAQFCVGFATPYEGLAGALGMAVDVGTDVGDVSYIRLEGDTGCSVPTWTDIIDLDPNPSGNWCIDVTVREL